MLSRPTAPPPSIPCPFPFPRPTAVPPADTQQTGTFATLHEVERQIEARVGSALAVAEQSLARRFGAGCVRALRAGLRGLLIALLLAYFAFGAAFLVVRHGVLPGIEDHRAALEAAAGRALNARVRIGRIEADWYGLNPRLKLTDVRLTAGTNAGERPALVLPQLDATLSWSSLWHLSPRFVSLSVLAPELDVRRRADGSWQIAGFVFDPRLTQDPDADARALDWLLGQRRIAILDARVNYVDELVRAADGTPQRLLLEDVQFRADAGWRSNRFALRATPPGELAAPLDLRATITRPLFGSASRIALWSGRAFAQTDFVDLARFRELARWLPDTVRLDAAQGALRLWIEFDKASVRRVASDLALADVAIQFGPGLAPLALTSLRGRLALREFGNDRDGGHELVLDGFSMSGRDVDAVADRPGGARVALAPTSLRLQLARASEPHAQRGEFEASVVSLEQWSALAAHVPLARELRALIARQALRGELMQVSARWEGALDFDADTGTLRRMPGQYSIKSRFANLASAAIDADPPLDALGHARLGVPGFQNLSGHVELTQSGGLAQIESRTVSLEFPGVFEEPRKAFSALTGSVQWSRAATASIGAPLELRIDRLAAVNDDINLTINGSWRAGGKGSGLVDLTARIETLAAREAHRYLPLGIGADTRTWLRDALRAGTATDGTIRVRGDLADFPYADGRSGEFRASARVRNATLDFAPNLRRTTGTSWPALQELDADLVFERNRMQITGRRALSDNVVLTNLSARIADLGAIDVHLRIAGKLRGPLSDMVRAVAQSPVGPRLGGVLAGATASGDAGGELELDVPLSNAGARVTVRGSVALAGNDVALRGLPPFTRASGTIEFTDRSLQLTGITAGFIGGQAQLSAETLSDGAIVFKGSGSATPAGARRLLDTSLAQRVFDRASGSTRYDAIVTVREGRPAIRVDSDLVGWSLDLPPPLGKTAGEPLPLRVSLARSDSNANRDRIDIGAGSVFALQFERDLSRADDVRVTRGTLRISDESPTEAPILPDSGVLAEIAIARLDLDRWQALLPTDAASTPAARSRGGDGSGLPDLVAARVRELRIAGKPIANVVLGATRLAEGPNAGGWQINADSDQASGALLVRLAEAGQDARVTARLARLTIPDAQRSEITELLDAPATDMPAFDVVAENFELGKRKLGRLELLAQNIGRPAADGAAGAQRDWQLQKLEIVNPDGKLAATGQWVRASDATPGRAAARRMALKLALDFSDGGALLTRLGIEGALRATAGKLDGEIAWRGSPFAIDFPTLEGELRLQADKGQFLKADAGAGRLLGVMSLQSLPRRLTLDFRDVFSDGFAFDSLRASASISSGVLATRDLRMRGVSATVLMEGSVDIARETQNLHVLVLPEINAGSASLLYALANPAIGLGTFLAQWVLRDPLSKAFSFEYDVTGSWSDPLVKRREKTVAEDPAKKTPQ